MFKKDNSFVSDVKEGFLINKGEYAAVPYGNSGYIILHNGQQLEKLCRTESSARKYITEHKKSLTRGQLPL
jgi:hypothetical protein